jgi:hypothetical protein
MLNRSCRAGAESAGTSRVQTPTIPHRAYAADHPFSVRRIVSGVECRPAAHVLNECSDGMFTPMCFHPAHDFAGRLRVNIVLLACRPQPSRQ